MGGNHLLTETSLKLPVELAGGHSGLGQELRRLFYPPEDLLIILSGLPHQPKEVCRMDPHSLIKER